MEFDKRANIVRLIKRSEDDEVDKRSNLVRMIRYAHHRSKRWGGGVGTGSLSDVTDEAKLGSAKTHQSLKNAKLGAPLQADFLRFHI